MMPDTSKKKTLMPYGVSLFLARHAPWRKGQVASPQAKALQTAIARRQIVPFYQTFVDARTGRLAGIEVLARWKHPLYGYISPDVFIPLAEQHQLIVPLTHLLMQQVISDLQHQINRFPSGIYICINISAQNCLDPAFASDSGELLNKFNAIQTHVVVEITERHPLHFTPQLSEWFAALRRSNISVALDDFGTGYSNLSYISALDPEFIKIDKMFVSQIGVNADTRLLDSVIALAKNLRLKVIAEGVETEAQAAYLRAQHVDFMQGYYFSRPVSAAELIHAVTVG